MSKRVVSGFVLVAVTAVLPLAACDDAVGSSTGGAASSASTGTTASSSDASSSSTGTPGGSVANDYCAPLAALVCGRAVSCGCGAVLPSGTLDEAACAAAWEAKCLSAYAPVVQAVEAHVAHVDSGRAAACIALLTTSTPGCERPRGAVALGLCPAWFASDEPLGASCTFPICAGGDGYCDGGTCKARPASGGVCAHENECAVGSLCLGGTCRVPSAAGEACDVDDACGPPLRCVAGKCVALGAPGAACVEQTTCGDGLSCPAGQCVDSPPTPCSDVAMCGNQDVCAHVRRCAPLGQAGAPCGGDSACAKGFGCDTSTSTCAVLPGDGAPCLSGTSCGAGLACSFATGQCAVAPGMGEMCGMDAVGPFVCATGLACLGDNTCGPPPTAGEPCAGLNVCATGFGCDFTPNGSFCVDLRAEGGACQNDLVCQSGLHCDFGVGQCAKDAAVGAQCKDGNECADGDVCLPGSGGAFVCAPTPKLGDACQFDCEPGAQCVADPADAFCASPICLEI